MKVSRLLDGRLKLRHLVLVDALSEYGSLVGAAAHLRVTQPVLTRALREVEEILGVPLYERGSRGVTPTLYGTVFTDHARAVLGQLTQAGRHIAELVDGEQGSVTVGTYLAGSNLLLPRAITRLKAERPRITVAIREATPDLLLNELEAGRLDLIVGRITGLAARAATVQEPLYDEQIRLVTRAGHPAVAAPGLTLADLIDFPWILPGPETALRTELEQLFLRHRLPLPANRVECTSILALRHLLVETDMIATLPMLIALDDPRLAVLPAQVESIGHTVGVTLPADRTANPSTAALLAQLSAVAVGMRELVSAPG